MPRYCSFVGCKNVDIPPLRDEGITFHKFPKDEARCKQWVQAMNQVTVSSEPLQLSRYPVLCSKHFLPNMFDSTGRIARLRDDAVPTEFDFSVLKGSQKRKKNIEKKIPMKVALEEKIPVQGVLEGFESKYCFTQEEGIDTLLPCAALNCSSDTSWRFFRFPKDKDLCLTWIQNCQRDDLLGQEPGFLNENYQLCERHFDDVQFVKRCRTNLLKWNAVPTIFDSSTVNFVKKRLNSESETNCKRLKSDTSDDASFNFGNELPSHFADFVGTDPSMQVCAETPIIDILSLSNLWSIDTIIHSAKQLGMRGPMLEFFEERLKKCCRDNKQTMSAKKDPSGSVNSQPSQNEGVGPKARVVIQQCRSAKLMVKPATETIPDLFVQINRGIIVFVCFLQGSSSETVQKLAKTVLNVRLSEAVDGKLVSVLDLPGDVLIVPQATLGGRIKGTAMQYHKNLDKAVGEQLYNDFVDAVQKIFDVNTAGVDHGCSVLKGTYGNRQVLSVNTNGPYTHLIEI